MIDNRCCRSTSFGWKTLVLLQENWKKKKMKRLDYTRLKFDSIGSTIYQKRYPSLSSIIQCSWMTITYMDDGTHLIVVNLQKATTTSKNIKSGQVTFCEILCAD